VRQLWQLGNNFGRAHTPSIAAKQTLARKKPCFVRVTLMLF
jgi:hypothetical protein